MLLNEQRRWVAPLFVHRPVTGRCAAAAFCLLVNPKLIVYSNNLHCLDQISELAGHPAQSIALDFYRL
jgi:hypothetical protein